MPPFITNRDIEKFLTERENYDYNWDVDYINFMIEFSNYLYELWVPDNHDDIYPLVCGDIEGFNTIIDWPSPEADMIMDEILMDDIDIMHKYLSQKSFEILNYLYSHDRENYFNSHFY